jgi:hypothetical protein
MKSFYILTLISSYGYRPTGVEPQKFTGGTAMKISAIGAPSRSRCLRPSARPGAGAHDPLGSSQQHRPSGQLRVQKFAEILAAKSGGKLKVREFAASQLGNEMQMQSALRGGTQEMLSASTTSLASVVKEFGLLDFPFAVSTTAQAEALVAGPFGQAMIACCPRKI